MDEVVVTGQAETNNHESGDLQLGKVQVVGWKNFTQPSAHARTTSIFETREQDGTNSCNDLHTDTRRLSKNGIHPKGWKHSL